MLLPARLRALKFKRELFPDGWFWHKELPAGTPLALAALRAAGALRAANDPVLLQYCERDHTWQGVVGGQAVPLTFKQASDILTAMEAVGA